MATIIGTDGDDILIGTVGDDRIIASAGDDTITGGDGRDTIDYSGLEQPVTLQPVVIQKGVIGTDTFRDFFETVKRIILFQNTSLVLISLLPK